MTIRRFERLDAMHRWYPAERNRQYGVGFSIMTEESSNVLKRSAADRWKSMLIAAITEAMYATVTLGSVANVYDRN